MPLRGWLGGVKVLPVKQIVEGELRLNDNALWNEAEDFAWTEIPAQAEVKGEELIHADFTRGRSGDGLRRCTQGYQLSLGEHTG